MYIYKRVSIVKFVVSRLKAGKKKDGPPESALAREAPTGNNRDDAQVRCGKEGIVVRIDLVKQHLCDVLYDMCETRRLSEITVTDVAREAGVSLDTAKAKWHTRSPEGPRGDVFNTALTKGFEQIIDLQQEPGQIIEKNVSDELPANAVIVMNKPVAQTRNI